MNNVIISDYVFSIPFIIYENYKEAYPFAFCKANSYKVLLRTHANEKHGLPYSTDIEVHRVEFVPTTASSILVIPVGRSDYHRYVRTPLDLHLIHKEIKQIIFKDSLESADFYI